eukprot:CAMPEP_0171726470 /NCGR_PEP_ID=MMETSP0991-20121206/25677_1 /TAXON_ID=483369 /ORGANISM="non described non described, Strain CCMP2098" /LENGTH=133 /DNA_ID=CAMNT_0012319943 /DNA_START=643 /DNA_END=1041 /DNA_ORIENTATION=+
MNVFKGIDDFVGDTSLSTRSDGDSIASFQHVDLNILSRTPPGTPGFNHQSLEGGTLQNRVNFHRQTANVQQSHPLTRGDITVDFDVHSRPGASVPSRYSSETQKGTQGCPRVELFSRSQRRGVVSAEVPRPQS